MVRDGERKRREREKRESKRDDMVCLLIDDETHRRDAPYLKAVDYKRRFLPIYDHKTCLFVIGRDYLGEGERICESKLHEKEI